MAFPPWEIAELSVGGGGYSDWETVLVKRSAGESTAPYFLFTATEKTGGANVVFSHQIVPGEDCTITLAGQLALTGKVNARQVAFDAHRHGVQISGQGMLAIANDSSIDTKKLGNGGQFKDQTLSAISQKVLGLIGQTMTIGPSASGGMNQPIKDVQVTTGESPMDLINKLGKIVDVRFHEDDQGKVYAWSRPEGGGGATLVEGKNILEARITIQDLHFTAPMVGMGEREAGTNSDTESGAKSSQVRVDSPGNTQLKYERPGVLIPPHPVTEKQLQQFVAGETFWKDSAEIFANVLVYGWLTGGSSGSLWKEGTHVMLVSAMADIHQLLWIKSVTFTQDNSGGTTTMLELWLDKGQGQVQLGTIATPENS